MSYPNYVWVPQKRKKTAKKQQKNKENKNRENQKK